MLHKLPQFFTRIWQKFVDISPKLSAPTLPSSISLLQPLLIVRPLTSQTDQQSPITTIHWVRSQAAAQCRKLTSTSAANMSSNSMVCARVTKHTHTHNACRQHAHTIIISTTDKFSFPKCTHAYLISHYNTESLVLTITTQLLSLHCCSLPQLLIITKYSWLFWRKKFNNRQILWPTI